MAGTKKDTSKTEHSLKKSNSTMEKNTSVGKTSKELLDKGLEASKKWFASAKKTIAEWGDESVKQVEIAKLNSKLEKGYNVLGKLVYSRLASKKTPVSISIEDEEIGEAVKILSDMAKKIKKLGGVPSTSISQPRGLKKSKEDKEEAKLLPAPKKRASRKKTSDSEEQAAKKSKKSSSSRKKTTDSKASAKKAGAKTTTKKTSGTSKKTTNSRSKKTKE